MKALVTIARVVVLLAAAESAAAMQPVEIANVVLISSATPGQRDWLVVTGRNFDPDGDISLTLGDLHLELLEMSSTVILAEIPGELSPGGHELVLWSGHGQVREYSVGVTVHAREPEPAPEVELPPGDQPRTDEPSLPDRRA